MLVRNAAWIVSRRSLLAKKGLGEALVDFLPLHLAKGENQKSAFRNRGQMINPWKQAGADLNACDALDGRPNRAMNGAQG